MKRNTVFLLTVPSAALFVVAGGVGTYAVMNSSHCWTESCRNAQQEAAVNTALAKAKSAWVNVSNLVQQQIDIGNAINATGHDALSAATTRANAQIDDLAFVRSGVNPLLDIAQPYIAQEATLADRRNFLQATFSNATQPIEQAVGNARLTVRREMPPTSQSAAHDFLTTVSDLKVSSLSALSTLHAARLITTTRTGELSSSLRANATALSSALAAYDAAARQLSVASKGRGSAGDQLPVALNAAQERQFATAGANHVVAFAEVPSPSRGSPSASTRNLAEQRARLSMEGETAANYRAAEALGREADEILASGQGGYAASMINRMDGTGDGSASRRPPIN